jgi:hypothetical protein
MAREQIPEAWIGELVRVGVSLAGNDAYIAPLEAVNDRGIVVAQQRAGGGTVPVFYPWSVVSWMHLTEERDTPYSEF